MNLKIAIIGCGAISEMWHIPAAVEILGSNNVSLVDKDTQRLEAMRRKFNICSSSSELSTIATSLDAAVIAVPPHVHPPIAEEAFEYGLSVLCEKPLANTSAECERIARAAYASHKVLAVCHTYRYFPNRIRLREMILCGEFGKLHHAAVEQGDPANWPSVSGYSFQKELVPGGVLLIEGLHSLDFILWCFGQPQYFSYIDDSIGGIESNSLVKCHYHDSFDVTFRVSRTCKLPNKITIKGDKVTAQLGIYDMIDLRIKSNNRENIIRCGNVKDNFYAIATKQLNDFLSSIEQGTEPVCNGVQGSSVVDFIETCYKAKKDRVRPNEVPLPGLMW